MRKSEALQNTDQIFRDKAQDTIAGIEKYSVTSKGQLSTLRPDSATRMLFLLELAGVMLQFYLDLYSSFFCPCICPTDCTEFKQTENSMSVDPRYESQSFNDRTNYNLYSWHKDLPRKSRTSSLRPLGWKANVNVVFVGNSVK